MNLIIKKLQNSVDELVLKYDQLQDDREICSFGLESKYLITNEKVQK